MIRKLMGVALALGVAPAQGGTQGEPLSRAFTAYELKVPVTHLGVGVDREGRLFSGTMDGVLVYDGTEWERVPIPNRYARQVDAGGDGRIYVGGLNTLGVMERSADGGWGYRELLGQVGIDPAVASIGPVMHLEPVEQGVVAVAQSVAMWVSADGRGAKKWGIDDSIARVMISGDRVYGCSANEGLVELDGGRPRAVPGGEALAGVRCVSLDDWGGVTVLISDAGLFELDAGSLRQIEGAERFEDLGPLTNRAVLADGSRVFGFLRGSLLHYDAERGFLRRMKPVSTGVRDVVADHEGGLWVASEVGLARLDYPSAWSLVGSERGLTAATNDAAWFDGAWWVATSQGLFKLVEKEGLYQAELVDGGPEGELFSLVAGQGGLLAGGVGGLMGWRPGQDVQWLVGPDEAQVIDALKPSRVSPGRVYAGGVDSLVVLRDSPSGWDLQQIIDAKGLATWAMAETPDGSLWTGVVDGGVERWKFLDDGSGIAERTRFGESEGLPRVRDRWSLSVLDGVLVAMGGGEAWGFDGIRFNRLPERELGERKLTELPKIVHTNAGVFAAGRDAISVRRAAEGGWTTHQFAGQPVIDVNEFRSNGEQVAVALLSGLLLYDTSAGSPPARPALAVGIGWARTTSKGLDGVSVVDGGVRVRSGEVLEVGFEAVRLGSNVSFRYRAPGVIEQWSRWSDSGVITMPVLSGRSYALEVEARAGDGGFASVRRKVEVIPRWYERVELQLGFGAVLLGLLALAGKNLSDRRLAAQKAYARNLEATVARRTQEVADAQKRLDAVQMTDPVTEVANKLAMERGLAREWIRCMDNDRPLAVILVDIDHFSAINEDRGYLGGDEVLRRVGYKLRTLIDPQRELVARIEGGKFLVLLPGVTGDAAQERAERIRQLLTEGAEETSTLAVVLTKPSSASSPDVLLSKVKAAIKEARKGGLGGMSVIRA